MKSGTSTLARRLSEHPRIHLSRREIHYFDRESNYRKGHEWYWHEMLVGNQKPEHELIVGDKTPTYCYQPGVAERIQKAFPDVRLVWIFRNPVDRTFSNYLHARKSGFDLRGFRFAVFEEPRRIRRNRFFGYVERSKYARQVQRFLDWFPREQMHFLLFEDLVEQPTRELLRLTRFLGVAPLQGPIQSIRANQTRMPCSVHSMWLARKLFGNQSRWYRAVRRLNLAVAAPTPKIDPELAIYLARLFESHNRELSNLTGLDLSGWSRPVDSRT